MNICSFNRGREIFLDPSKSSNSGWKFGSFDFLRQKWDKEGKGDARYLKMDRPILQIEAERRSFVSLSRRHSNIIALAENSRDRSIDPLSLVHDDRRSRKRSSQDALVSVSSFTISCTPEDCWACGCDGELPLCFSSKYQ